MAPPIEKIDDRKSLWEHGVWVWIRGKSPVEFLANCLALATLFTTSIAGGYSFLQSIGWLAPGPVAEKLQKENSDLGRDTSKGITDLEARLAQLEKSMGDAKLQPSGVVANSVTSGAKDQFVVQLATYFTRNCETALEEIRSYESEFSDLGKPALYSSSDSTRVIIGVATTSTASAKNIVSRAKELSNQTRYKNESLGQAIVRKNPTWSPTKCS